MDFILWVSIFLTIFIFTIEIFITIALSLTQQKLKKIIDLCYCHISDINYERSRGENQSISDLSFISDEQSSLIPKIFQNYLCIILRDKVYSYIIEESVSCRERSKAIAERVIHHESWLLKFKLNDLKRLMSFIRLLYVPICSLAAIAIFTIGYSSMSANVFNTSFDGITNNIFLISLTMKTAGSGLLIGLLAYITSLINSFIVEEKKSIDNLAEAIFQLKATNLRVRVD